MDPALHVLTQSLRLLGAVALQWALLALVGAWAVWTLFPRFARVRWPIFAPIAGIALVTIIGLPLVKSGVPVLRFASALAAVGTVLSLGAGVALARRESARRWLFAWLRRRGPVALAVTFLVVTVAAALMTAAARSDIRDAWGSGDFAAYWVVSDYLQQHGGSTAAYEAQQNFRALEVRDHLERYGRLGNMTYLAWLGAVTSPQAVQHVINPAIVSAMLLVLALAAVWLRQERLNAWGLTLVVLHPFLYFLLYFSYESQVTAVVLFCAGMLVAGRSPAPVAAATGGALIGAAVLHHPAIAPAALIYGSLLGMAALRSGRLLAPLVGALSALVVVSHYAFCTLRELAHVTRAGKLPGWDWRGPIGSLEFLGVRSVLGWNLPEARAPWLLALDAVVALGLGALLLLALRRVRLTAFAWTLVLTTAATTGIAVMKFFQHVPHATHAIVKTMSLFAPFLVLLAALPLARGLAAWPKALAAGVMLVMAAQVATLWRSPLQRPALESDCVELARRILARWPEARLRFPPDRNTDFFWPVLRDERRLAPAGALAAGDFQILSRRETPRADLAGLETAGDYYALPGSLSARHVR